MASINLGHRFVSLFLWTQEVNIPHPYKKNPKLFFPIIMIIIIIIAQIPNPESLSILEIMNTLWD